MATYNDVEAFVEESASLSDTADLSGANGIIQRAYEQVVRDSKCYVGTFSGQALTQGVREYDIPTVTGKDDILAFIRLWVSSSATGRKRLIIQDEDTMEELLAGDTAPEGTPRFATISGFNLLELATPPGTGVELSGKYAKRPAQVTGDDTFDPVVPREYHHAIELYALYLAWVKEDRPEDANTALVRYQEELARVRQGLRHYAGVRVPALKPSRLEYPTGQRSDYWQRMGY